jgi:ElaB/YqjD/DUF883 family membrane-anchored ribosome-binding protein
MVETRYDEQMRASTATGPAAEAVKSWRDQIIERFNQGRDQAKKVPEYSRAAAGQVNEFVRERPWVSIGVMCLCTFALGLFAGRRARGRIATAIRGMNIEDLS